MKFSVLMSVYINEKVAYLDSALSSIFNQTLLPDELVIVHDGVLTKELYDSINRFKSRLNIVEVKIPFNVGLGRALKVGIKVCKYDYVIRCDSDDINHSDRFAKQMLFFKNNPSVSVVSAHVEEFKHSMGDLKLARIVPIGFKNIKDIYRSRNPINHMAVAFNRNDVLKVGGYEHMPFFEDYNLWVNLIQNGYRIENINEVLVSARVGNGMIARRKGIRYIKSELNFYRNLFNNETNIPLATYLFIFVRLAVRFLPISCLEYIYMHMGRKQSKG